MQIIGYNNKKLNGKAYKRHTNDAIIKLISHFRHIKVQQHAHNNEELHVVGQIPCLLQALCGLLPGDDVVQIQDVPIPGFSTAVLFFKLVEPWTIASQHWNNLPQEQNHEKVKGSKSKVSGHYNFEVEFGRFRASVELDDLEDLE